ncbi:MAG TPA: M56 family metallopeptidase [Bacteroidales bacterium]|mgnify:CR=1 FL=1|jgi:beta-lactamase regulating signal transducer with metallopeptidase domain|nr:M56 family metallopeptidase [Bacteroidales bacterium]HRT33882.1 M56 family metallopeptidase [Bacteroidales bacterium]HRT83631.1 M56 family metallopeptidase [Bacteroidales bacterium]
MGDLFVYILKSSLCLTVFYLFFKLLLSRETLYKFNRIVLLSLFAIALIIPFIHISFAKDVPYSGLALNIDQLIAMAASEESVAVAEKSSVDVWILGIFILYIAGVLFFLARMALSMVRIIMMVRSSDTQRQSVEGVSLIIHKKEMAPFSWMRYIVISEKDYLESSREIITHELAHIEGRHSLDLILAEVITIMHWFNPAAYLLKQELRNIHEYQADEAVIDKGIDAKQYQLLLIKKAVGDRLYTMANSFNHSKLKNRITMISKKKSNRMAAVKALFVLPLSALAVVAFASEKMTSEMEVISNAKITEIFAPDTIKNNVKKEANVKVKSEGQVKGEKTYTITVNDENQGNTSTEKVVKYMVRDTINVTIAGKDTAKAGFRTGYIRINNADTKDTIRTFVTFMDESKTDVIPLCIIDGKEVDIKVMKALDPGAIHSISVLKDKAAIDIYGDKGKNGVLVITLKSVSVDRSYDDKNITTIRIRGAKENNDVLYVIDGKVMDSKDAMEIEPDQIKSMSVLKGDVAKAKYGDKVKSGVIEITLKEKTQR